jgi:pyruvate dehydrogenase E1 component alpha subunit
MDANQVAHHPYDGTDYERLEDGTVKVTAPDGTAGIFTVEGIHLSGPLTWADQQLLVWIRDTSQPAGGFGTSFAATAEQAATKDLEPTTATRIFELATRIKACDERLQSIVMSGQAALMFYSPRGQEVLSASMMAALRPDDYVVTTYRGLHDQVAKGVPLRELFAEYLGKATGTCKGKGGAMHVTHPASGLMVTTGVVGGGIPIANGLALSAKLRAEDRVTVCSFGDGATNIGAFHESMNLASLWKLPVVFLCQNNLYAEHTTYADGTTSPTVADRASSYSMVGVRVDGNDAAAMHSAARAAVDRARRGDGPTLLEAMTYRFLGHFFGDDPSHHQPADEYAAAVAADPLLRLRDWLLECGLATENQLADIEANAVQDADDAAEFGLASPMPDPEELHRDVFADQASA